MADKIKSFTGFRETLKHKIIIFDGAMGTSLQKQNLSADNFGGEKTFGCNDYLVLTYPDAVEKVHRSFLDVGADVIETDTFRANRLTLGEYGLGDKTFDINFAAAQLARRLADEYSQSTGQPRYVAGAMGPSGKLPSINEKELSNITFNELSDLFYEQAAALIDGGVDLLLIETSQDILEVKAAITGIRKALIEKNKDLPIQAQITLDTTGKMLLGTDIGAALAILEGMPIDVIGLNCSTGPEHMRVSIEYLGENTHLPISCIPNAGLPLNIDGEAVYPMAPEPFAELLGKFVINNNINIVGGCCGTTPDHISLLVKSLKDITPQAREINKTACLASATIAVPMRQEPAPFLIGERLNTQGSRRFKELIIKEDYEAILDIARSQIDNGAHGLDVCVALTERSDEAETMQKVVKSLAPVIQAPFIIDTTEPDVLEAALQSAPGKCLINSTNFENGRAKADLIFSLARKYNAAVMVLTIDENGMAKTPEEKLRIARKGFEIAVKDHGIPPGDLVFDALTFTLATGDPEYADSARHTLDGIKLIKTSLPGVMTSLGVSNVSFGLSQNARSVINSIMLYHAVQAGLDMAIVNPAHIKPYAEITEVEKSLAEDLLFNKTPDALYKLISYFAEHKGDESVEKVDQQLHNLPIDERIQYRIVQRKKDGIEQDIDVMIDDRGDLSRHERAVQILNSVLLPAMKTVGDKFGSGELILPFVLQSAEVMKRAVTHLEKYLEKQEGVSKGKVVIATVYGDVHDIGKNLVKTIFSNNGYEVIDLGKQVPAETIISTAVKENADAIGLSALLVSTSKQMPLIINELHRRNLNFPVLIGGAAINKRFGRRILLTDSDEYYSPGVYYCKDAFEGLETIDAIIDPDRFKVLKQKNKEESAFELGRSLEPEKPHLQIITKSQVRPAESIPTPPKWGVFTVNQMPIDSVAQYVSKNDLYRLSWGAKNKRGDEWKALEQAFEQRFNSMRKSAIRTKWLSPKGIYGYWPVQSDGDELIVYHADTYQKSGQLVEFSRFNFPRQSKGEYLCLSDYFSPKESGIIDVVAFQIVTVGQRATDLFDSLQDAGNYSEAYYTHGFAVQMAEAAAEYLHRHIRQELKLKSDQGKRYSWGYPAIPELSEHAKVFQLLPAEKELGMSLTSAYQLVPEQSTAAIVLHHPDAKYYNVGDRRIDQLLK